jgi:hypothetical protein
MSSGTRTVMWWNALGREEGRKKPEAFLSSDVGESQGSKPERLRKTCSDPRVEGTEIRHAGRYQRPGDLPRHSKDRTTSFRLPGRIAIYQRTCGTRRTGEHQHPHSLRERLGSWHPRRADISSTTHTPAPGLSCGRSRRTTTPSILFRLRSISGSFISGGDLFIVR